MILVTGEGFGAKAKEQMEANSRRRMFEVEDLVSPSKSVEGRYLVTTQSRAQSIINQELPPPAEMTVGR